MESGGKKQESKGKKQGESDGKKKDFSGKRQVSGCNKNQVSGGNNKDLESNLACKSHRKRYRIFFKKSWLRILMKSVNMCSI